jgi:hypothetical protein
VRCSKIRTADLPLILRIALYLYSTLPKAMQKIKTRFQVFVITVILGLTIFGLSSLSYASAASYNNVQVFVQTKSSLPDYFIVSAFNMSGYMVASSQSYYPAASFELPNGQYIFAATAEQQYYSTTYYYPPTPVKATDLNSSLNSSGVMIPVVAQEPVVEYGYSLVQVANSTSITISTMNVTSLKTSRLAIKVAYANGTAAEGASVSASILGGNFWGYGDNVVMSNTTDADGVSTLIMPQAPVQVYAWSWLPVNLPNGPSSVQVVVGGEKVNVTVYWQPMSVGLAGSTVIVPPGAGASISLRVQQSDYWVMTNGVQGTATAGMGVGMTSASESGSIPAAVYQQSQGSQQGQSSQVVLPTTITSTVTYSNPRPTTSDSVSESSNSLLTGSALLVMIVAVLALAVAVLSILLVARTRRQ